MKALYSIGLVLLFAACNSNVQPPDKLAQLFNGELEIIDLTHSINDSSPFWPSGNDKNPFSYNAIARQPSGASSLGSYSTVEHYGTHLDAPIHFADNTASVDEIDTKDFFAPLAVIDVRKQCEADSDYRLSVQDIKNWESKHGELPEGAVVLMSTGWSEKWGDMAAYRNQDEDGKMHFPGFSVEVNTFLVNERNIKGIGIDNLSIDYGLSSGFEAHGITNGAGKYHLENVANLHTVPEAGAYLIVAPIKIEGGSGGQVRIFALIP